MREVSSDAGKLGLLLIEESTRISKFEADMLIATVRAIVDEKTRLGFIGDPCQTKPTLRSLECTSSLHSADVLNVSLVNWILELCIREEADANSFVQRTDLLNRYKKSRRCREGACRAVNSLAPMALPGKRAFWETIVGHEKVWADLKPQDPQEPLDAFLCDKTKEIPSVRPMPARWLRHIDITRGDYQSRSRFDADTALYSAITAVHIGVLQRRLGNFCVSLVFDNCVRLAGLR